jgi:hypothetical protein
LEPRALLDVVHGWHGPQIVIETNETAIDDGFRTYRRDANGNIHDAFSALLSSHNHLLNFRAVWFYTSFQSGSRSLDLRRC